MTVIRLRLASVRLPVWFSFSATLRGKLRGKGGAVAVARKLSVTAG